MSIRIIRNKISAVDEWMPIPGDVEMCIVGSSQSPGRCGVTRAAGYGARIAALCAIVLVPMASPADEANDEARWLSNTRQLTFEGRRAGEGYFSRDGQRLIFQSERDPANPFYQIHLLDLATGDVQRISPGTGKATCSWIHPRGDRVLYASTDADPQTAAKMRAELDFRASGQQRRYSWDFDPQYEIYAQDLTDGSRINLTRSVGYDAEGAYSPDGRLIVFASNRAAYDGSMTDAQAAVFEHDKSYMMDIYLMNADGTEVRRLTDTPGYDGGPFFSPDGAQITWRRFSTDGSRAEIHTMDLATGVQRQVTRMGVMSWAPFFHPSGDYLIFASNREGFANFELFIVDAAGRREPERVTFTGGFDGLPVFSPDGARLAWTSNRTSNQQSQLFIADWNDAEARRQLQLPDSRAIAAAAVVAAADTTLSEIRAEDARLHVVQLAGDAMQGRLTGTAGERLATDYVAGVFERIGLEPAGDDGYFQAFPFTAAATLGEGNHLRIAGVDGTDDLQVDRDWRPLALSRSGEVPATGVVFAGYGIVAPGTDKVPDYDAYGGLDVAGKWVMVLRFQPESVPPESRRHLLHYSDLAYKAAVAKRHGAVGLIVVTGPNAAARDRLVELRLDTAGATTTLGGISVSDALAERMLQTVGRDLTTLQTALDKGESAEGFDLGGVQLAAVLDIQREKGQGRNVLARLPATSASGLPPLAIGAHVDHLGHGQVSGSLAHDDERGAIHHGADDNASGVAAMLEIAQHLAGLRREGRLQSRRDILFAAWSGEELGTLGSQHFVDRLAGTGDLRGKVAAYLNMDMVGHLKDRLYLQATGSSPIWTREIERRNVPLGLPIATKADPYLPTDSTPFYMQGVPVLNAFTGAHEDYSSPRDTADTLNYAGIRDVARLFDGIAASLARAEDTPEYVAVTRQSSGLSRSHLRAYLGTIPAYGQDEAVKGVRLQGAVKGAPAERAGVRNGDLLVGLAGIEIASIHDFMNALAGLKAGEPTGMTVLRNGETLVLEVVPTARE